MIRLKLMQLRRLKVEMLLKDYLSGAVKKRIVTL